MNGHIHLNGIDVSQLPLPIAYEVTQLKNAPPGFHLERCKQLVSTFEFALRYCAVLVLSEYRRLTSQCGFRSIEFESTIANNIDNPTPQVCADFIRVLVRHFRHQEDRLFVPELYQFAFNPDGSASATWHAIGELLRFGSLMSMARLDDLENRLAVNYDQHLPYLLEVLGALDWLHHYQLLQVIDCRPIGETFQWTVRLLQGDRIRPQPVEWYGQPSIECRNGRTLVVRNLRTKADILLLPYTIFTLHQIRPNDGLDFQDDFFYYEYRKYGSMTYVGLRNNEERMRHLPSRPGRITLEDYVQEIEDIEKRFKSNLEPPVYWTHLVTRCRAITQDQLTVFNVDKYDPGVYVPRDSVMRHWAGYLEDSHVGILIVGDSGTGKTNFLCSLAETLKDAGEAVILYNCADIREECPDVTGILQRSFRFSGDVYQQLCALGAATGKQAQRRLFLLFDAVNESKRPAELMDSLVDLARELTLLDRGNLDPKLIITCRTETWSRLQTGFQGDHYFYRPLGEVALRLQRFHLTELRQVYDKYRVRYKIHTEYDELSDNVKNFMRDPLMMRLVCTSFAGSLIQGVPKTRQVFQNYVNTKIGYSKNEKLRQENREELAFVQYILQKMINHEREELDILSDLREDPEIQQMMLDPDITTPYWQLRDKGVLTAFGRQDATDPQPHKVKFTYDRVFEYLLQKHSFGERELRLTDLELITRQLDKSAKFVSLWGAVRVALQMYLDEREATDTPLLVALARSNNQLAHAMLIDMLVEYALNNTEKVRAFVIDVLLSLNDIQAGRIAVQSSYQVGLAEGLHAGLVHKCDEIRQLATQYTFYLWQRSPKIGEDVVQQLFDGIEKQFESLTRSVIANLLKSHKLSDAITGLSSFMNLGMLVAGYAYMGESSIYPVGQRWADFVRLVSQRAVSTIARAYSKRWGYTFIVDAFGAAPDFNAQLLRVIFDYDVVHEYRACIGEFARYLDPRKKMPQSVLDRMFAVAQESIATPMFFIAMIFYARGKLPEREETFAFCRRLFDQGNIQSKNLALRIAALITYIEGLGGEYITFVEEMLLELWTGQEAEYIYPCYQEQRGVEVRDEKSFKVGYLQFPVIHECRTKTGGPSAFIQRILALPWNGDPKQRIIRVIDCLDDGLCIASSTRYTNIAPMLGTIAQWVGDPDVDVRLRVVAFLRLARSFYTGQVDQFLDGLLDDTSTSKPENAKAVRDIVYSVREKSEPHKLTRLWTGSGIVVVPWLLQKSPLFVRSFGELLVGVSESKTSTWDDALLKFGSKVGSLEMLCEISALLSGEPLPGHDVAQTHRLGGSG